MTETDRLAGIGRNYGRSRLLHNFPGSGHCVRVQRPAPARGSPERGSQISRPSVADRPMVPLTMRTFQYLAVSSNDLAQPCNDAGTLPPLSANFLITCWDSHMFILAESAVSPL